MKNPRSLTASLPLKNGWLEDDPASYWVSVTFQGRTVKLREGIRSTEWNRGSTR